MEGIKVKALIAAIIIAGGGATVAVVNLTKGSKGISSAAAGAKIAAFINAGPQTAKIVKVLKCLTGKNNDYLCAVAVSPDGKTIVCALAGGTVAPGFTKVTSFAQADPTVCYFASS